jgi:hypothetical protein
MNEKVALLLAATALCACHKKEEAAQTATTQQAPPANTSLVASPAPSETAAASASAAPSASVSESDKERARLLAIDQAREFGLIGLINSDGGAPTAPWGREDSLSAKGNMWGDQIGDSFGAGGLGLRGTGGDGGESGGGRGEGIGLGNIGTIGHGAGTGTGQGFGSGQGRLGGARSSSTPKIRQGATTVNGRLPPEVIQRIVRQNFGRFRLCYENGLRSDPKLAGTVATKFVIGTDGSVTSTSRDSSTTMTDAGVVACVTRGFSNLSFPQPEGGVVVVIYPLVFAPGDAP